MQISTDDTSGRAVARRRISAQISDFVGIDGLLVAVLLGFLCLRVWGMGPMHTDDAMWALMAHQPFTDPVHDWATGQGRLWALVIGPMMRYALFREGTPYGEILKLGSFAVFFLSFYAAAAVYWGRRVAGLAAALFVGLYALRWEGSALTTYPLLVWVSATACVVAILIARYYFKNGGVVPLASCGLLFFVSLFNNEGVTLLFGALFFCSLVANVWQSHPSIRQPFRQLMTGRSRSLLVLGILVCLSYGLMAGAWMALHPSHYDGHSFAHFDATRIMNTLLSFSLSGSVLFNFIQPYVVVYVDAVMNTGAAAIFDNVIYANAANTGVALIYNVLKYGNGLLSSPIALIAGLMFGGAIFVGLNRKDDRQPTAGSFMSLALVGIAVAWLAILPVAATQKYQEWHLDLGVQSYTMTVLAHFGVSLLLAAALFYIRPVSEIARWAILVIAAVLGLVGAVTYRMNDAIAADMRPEAARWRVMALTFQMLDAAQQSPAYLFAPRFRNGSWFTVLPANYWTDYAEAKYKRRITIYTAFAELVDVRSDISILDYSLLDDDRHFVVSLSHAVGAPTERQIADVAILSENMDPSTLANYVVSYTNLSGEVIQKRLVELPASPINSRVLLLSGLSARPGSIAVVKGSTLSDPVKMR